MLHLATFGGTGAEALKDGIDSTFAENGPLHLPDKGYKFKVVTCTSGNASVNFRQENWLGEKNDWWESVATKNPLC